jgi:hypothetical protein
MMAAAASGFQLASEIGPSPSEREAFETLLQSQASQLEDLRAAGPRLAAGPDLATLQKIGELLQANKELQATLKDQSEQIGLLRDGIVRLQAEVASSLQSQGRQAEDLARGLQRIRALENPKKDSETNNKRAAKIKEYLAENGTPGKFLDKRTMKLIEGRAVRFELLRSYLEIDKWQLNRALRSLLKIYPGEYCKKKLNKTTWILVERPKL